MKIIKQIQWVRIFSEGTAIVVSILLAFAIDAWWERRSEAAQALALEEGLRADFLTLLDDHTVGRVWIGGRKVAGT